MIRVLVVDDSVVFRAAATDVILAADGFELAGAAQSGEQAVELACISRPDLALIDINMPGLDGYETAARLAKESPATMAVLMTAMPDPSGRPGELFDKRKLSPTALSEIWQGTQKSSAF
ncbi:MAG TPA: response regulator [Polyangiaceae bacterium]